MLPLTSPDAYIPDMRDRYHEQLGLLDVQLDRMCQLVADAMRLASMATLNVSLLSPFHERFADHAVSVAHHVAYAITGEHRNVDDTALAVLAVHE